MMELIKNNIHMNRQKGTAVSQITLDDDFIVPDTMDDVSSVLLGSGDIQIESSKVQGDKVLIRGKLMFCVLYRRESGGLQALKGEIPFEETVNVPDLEERDYTQVSWNLEDLSTGMINSRKLNIKAVVMLEVRVESLYDAEAAVDVQTDDGQVELCRRNIDVAALAVRRKDTYRIREELSLSANKPNMETILWREMKLRGTACRSGEGSMHLDGELMILCDLWGRRREYSGSVGGGEYTIFRRGGASGGIRADDSLCVCKAASPGDRDEAGSGRGNEGAVGGCRSGA